jgi:hypothetical protein
MIRFTINADGLEQEAERLEAMSFRVMDLMPIGTTFAQIMATDNMAARMQGVDKDNEPFAELAEATLKKWNRGMGPPLAPMESASRIISGFETEVNPTWLGVDVIGSWPSMDSFLGYHVTGTTHMPARDPVGIRPSAWAEMLVAFDAWVDSVVNEASYAA